MSESEVNSRKYYDIEPPREPRAQLQAQLQSRLIGESDVSSRRYYEKDGHMSLGSRHRYGKPSGAAGARETQRGSGAEDDHGDHIYDDSTRTGSTSSGGIPERKHQFKMHQKQFYEQDMDPADGEELVQRLLRRWTPAGAEEKEKKREQKLDSILDDGRETGEESSDDILESDEDII